VLLESCQVGQLGARTNLTQQHEGAVDAFDDPARPTLAPDVQLISSLMVTPMQL